MKNKIVLLLLLIFANRFFSIENVLILNSYHAGFEWTENELSGFLSVFENTEQELELYYQFMDTKRYNESDYFSTLEEYYGDKFASILLDAVVVTDDDALTFILDGNLKFEKRIPIVFMGVSEPRDYTYFKEYGICGVEEFVDIANTLKCATDMFKEVRRILFIADDKTTTGRNYIKTVNKTMKEFTEYEYEIVSDIDYRGLISTVEDLEKDTAILFMSFAEDGDGNYLNDTETIGDICSVSNSPVFVLVEEQIGSGAIGGKVVSAFEIGKHAGEFLKRIIDGEIPEEIGIIREEATRYEFDYGVLRKYNVPGGLIPENSLIVNKPESIWDIQGTYLYSAITVFSVLLFFLGFSMFQAKEKKKYSRMIAGQSLAIEESISKLEATIKKSDDLNREYSELNKKLQNIIELMGFISVSMDLREFYGKIIENMTDLFGESNYIFFLVYEEDKAYLIDSEGNYSEFGMDLEATYELCEKTYTVRDNSEFEIGRLLPENFGNRLREKYRLSTSAIQKKVSADKNIVIMSVFDMSEMNSGFSEMSIDVLNSISILIKNYLKDRVELTEIRKAFLGFAAKLSLIAESKNEFEGYFSDRISILSGFIAEKLSMEKSLIEEIKKFSPLYDIGKVFVPPKILNKKTPLNESDWEIIKKHTVNSLQLLKGDHFELARTMALYHHERYDGSGYPLGISGEDIPIAAQITGLVDTYITLRILRKKTHSQAIEEIIFEGGQQKFNPKLMRILLDNGDAIEEKFDEA